MASPEFNKLRQILDQLLANQTTTNVVGPATNTELRASDLSVIDTTLNAKYLEPIVSESPSSLTTGQVAPLSLNTEGRLRVSIASQEVKYTSSNSWIGNPWNGTHWE